MDSTSQIKNKTTQVLIILASFVIVVAGMKAAESIVVPFLLAAFLSIIISPPFIWMQSKGIPKVLALLFIIVAFLSVLFLIGVLIGTSVNDFTSNLPFYKEKLTNQTQALINWLVEKNYVKPDFQLTKILNPAAVLNVVANALNQISGIFADGFLILFTVIFMSLEINTLPQKLKKVFNNPDKSLSQVNEIYQNINRYIGIKTLTSLGTGILVYIFLLIVGVDYPLLWGVLAFVLNYIPTIGSIIAVIPPLLLSLVQLGFIEAIVVLAGYITINTVIGNILEPKFMGMGLGLSTLVVFLSLVFWGWVLGPIGMILSVPLTITIKIALDSSEETRWLAVLLGPETFE
ncbi:MAG: AI-2E family transporter [Ignavibacteriaceae bacterium]|jgi:AI-2 transport protein TqsA|nr:AI-2E family transporter [Ignavibacteriaceae bacterium]